MNKPQFLLEQKKDNKTSWSRLIPFLMILGFIGFFAAVLLSMAFGKTSWEVWEDPLTFAFITVIPTILPLVAEKLRNQEKEDG